jgi:hypothetical protein
MRQYLGMSELRVAAWRVLPSERHGKKLARRAKVEVSSRDGTRAASALCSSFRGAPALNITRVDETIGDAVDLGHCVRQDCGSEFSMNI